MSSNMPNSEEVNKRSSRANRKEFNKIIKVDKDGNSGQNIAKDEKKIFPKTGILEYLNKKLFDRKEKSKNESRKNKKVEKMEWEATAAIENCPEWNSERYEITPSKRQRTRKLWTRAFQKVTTQRLQGTLPLTDSNKFCDNDDIEMVDVPDGPIPKQIPGCDESVSYGEGECWTRGFIINFIKKFFFFHHDFL